MEGGRIDGITMSTRKVVAGSAAGSSEALEFRRSEQSLNGSENVAAREYWSGRKVNRAGFAESER